MDILANSSSTWMRNVVHRNAQVAPEGIFLYLNAYILWVLHKSSKPTNCTIIIKHNLPFRQLF